jgi:hypothetical protein
MSYLVEFSILSALSFLFGITQKLADGHHEHGLNFFPGAGVVFGALFGGFGFYLIGYSSVLQAVYLAPLLYWFYKKKIDCVYHAIAAGLMLLGVAASFGHFDFPFFGVAWIFGGYVLLDYAKPYCPLNLKTFFAYRLHFHFVQLVYALCVWDIFGYGSLVFNLLGIAAANRFFSIPPAATQKPVTGDA